MRGSAALAAIGIALVATAIEAAADPCVQLVRVPDNVRPVIERWVAAEPRCRVHLSVRVLPTDGGLYVIATDGAGLVRERLVPDATTAAVLIASWVADDGAPAPAPTPTPAPAPAPAPAPVTPTWAQSHPPVQPAWAQARPPVKPPWATPPGGPGSVAPVDQPAPTSSSAPSFRRLVGLGVLLNEAGGGLRGEVDLFKKWHLRFGVLGTWLHTTTNETFFDNIAIDDVMVAAFTGNEIRFGRIDVRATIAAGFSVTTATSMSSGENKSMLSPYADASVTAGVAVTRRFEVRAGIDVGFAPVRIDADEWFHERDIIPQAVIALGYRGD